MEITPTLRAQLATALDELAHAAHDVGATPDDPLPVLVTLRRRKTTPSKSNPDGEPKESEIVLAKSNRPYAFLGSFDLPAVGARRPGELIIEGTQERLSELSEKIRTARTKADLYCISTFQSFTRWDTVDVIFGLNDADKAESMVATARHEGRALKVTFFPWTSREPAKSRLAIAQGPSNSSAAFEAFTAARGLAVNAINASSTRPVAYYVPGSEITAAGLAKTRGIRSVSVAPEYGTIHSSPQAFTPIRPLDDGEISLPPASAPTVGVLDSGIQNSILENVIAGRENWDGSSEINPDHGTFVGGLIVASAQTNRDSAKAFPADSSRIFDAQVLPRVGIAENLLQERIFEAITRNDSIKIWNCSFGSNHDGGTSEYGTFAQCIDELSDSENVLIVQAAGNYMASPLRKWPPASDSVLKDGITSPAEAIRSVTIGALAHKGGFVPIGMPSSYSRRGPSFALHVKPEVCHWAGDVGPSGGATKGFGINSLLPSGDVAESIGTSFSTPIVSTIAAHLWHRVEKSGSVETVRPELIKGLLVHSASINQSPSRGDHRQYFGWGTPPSSAEILGNGDDAFTTVHEVMLSPGIEWFKNPFPVPKAVTTVDGKFRGEVIVTITYSPPINPAFGSEAVRYDVSGAFGHLTKNGDDWTCRSIAAQEKDKDYRWENELIDDGKWSPIKTYRQRSLRGTKGGNWALRLTLTQRIQEELTVEQRVYVIVTFRSIDPALKVYQDGVKAVADLNLEHRQMVPSARVRVRGGDLE